MQLSDVQIFLNFPNRINNHGSRCACLVCNKAYKRAKKFIEEGQKVKKGQTIMIVEAMKTMNHVPSTQDGVVSKILVKDGEQVEFGQALISHK